MAPSASAAAEYKHSLTGTSALDSQVRFPPIRRDVLAEPCLFNLDQLPVCVSSLPTLLMHPSPFASAGLSFLQSAIVASER